MQTHSSVPRLRAALVGGLVVGCLLLPAASRAQWLYATGTTLEVAGTLVTPRDVVTDVAGLVSTESVGGLPPTSGLAGIHDDAGTKLFATRQSVTLPGSVFAERRDIASLSGSTYAIAFDGSAAGVPANVAIDGVSRDGSGDVLLSVDTSVEIAGVFAEDADVLRWDGAAFSLFFDASSVSVPPGLDVDGLHYDVAGDALLLTFDAAATIDGVGIGREDILRYEFGGGGWSIALDASTTEPGLATSDVVAVPEPATSLGLFVGALGLALRGRARSTR